MAVSIKIRESTKRRLERLQADLSSLGGKAFSLQEAVDVAVKAAGLEPAKALGLAEKPLLPLSPAAQKRVMERSFDWGVVTSAEDIDRVLYSDSAVHGRGVAPERRKR